MTWKRKKSEFHIRAMPPKCERPRTCPSGFFCSACKDYVLVGSSQKHVAFAMGLHDRLGAGSAVAALSPELTQKILHMTRTKPRQVPDWMGCAATSGWAAVKRRRR